MQVLTLADERYIPGAVGLVNSLKASGYDGEIVVGALDKRTKQFFSELSKFNIGYADLSEESIRWPGWAKPRLIKNAASDVFLFLDADIVVTNGRFIPTVEELLNYSPVFALEAIVGASDFRRKMWEQQSGINRSQPHINYYNSGMFAGKLDRDLWIVEEWERLNKPGSFDKKMENNYFKPGSNDVFLFPDQDRLNAILQSIPPDDLISIQPPDWWSSAVPNSPFFHVGGFWESPAFLHGTRKEKPWLMERAPNRLPDRYELNWYRNILDDPMKIGYEPSIPTPIKGWLRGDLHIRLSQKVRRTLARLKP